MRLITGRGIGAAISALFVFSQTVSPADWTPPFSQLPPPSVQLPAPHPWIALTFDDGPHPKMTEKLLEVLAHEKVPATFFVVGKMAERYPYLVQQMADGGHEIANHSYSHTRLSRLDRREMLSELSRTRDIIRRITGHDTLLYRPPGGGFSPSMVRSTSRAGYHMVLWSTLTKDVDGASSELIVQRIVRGAHDGGIVLMHSGLTNTLEALPSAIRTLQARGYQFVTVSTLLGFAAPPLVAPRDTAGTELAKSASTLTNH